MTIPRIGNKIVRVKNTQPQNPAPQSAPPAKTPEPAEFEEVSLDDMFGEAQEYESDETSTPEEKEQQPVVQPEQKQEEVQVVHSNRHPEDNYSIEKFTNDYIEKLHNDVLPILAQYEPERKQRFILAILCGAVCWVAAILVFFLVEGNTLNIVAGFIALGGFIWYIIKKQFEKKIKRTVMPTLMKAVPSFNWQLESPIPDDEINDAKIFPAFKESTKTFDDCFCGKYRGVDISIAECTYTANKKNYFQGAIIRIQMNKDFEGTTVIRPKKYIDCKDVSDLKKYRFQKIELEDAVFNKTYDVYSNDQVESRYLLTTAFMERFRNINMAFNTKVAFCAFYGKYVYIAPYCKNDLFSICNLLKSVTDETQFVKLFGEFTSILALVDHFKLDKKLGL